MCFLYLEPRNVCFHFVVIVLFFNIFFFSLKRLQCILFSLLNSKYAYNNERSFYDGKMKLFPPLENTATVPGALYYATYSTSEGEFSLFLLAL